MTFKIKPRDTSLGICRELDCRKPWTGFGFCDEHRAELNAALAKNVILLQPPKAHPVSNPIVIQPREDGLVHLTIAGGALLESPVWEQHYRGTNYLAIIDVSPEMPGGLGRHFINKGKGDCLYIVDQIAVLDAVEFAGDYTTGVGRRHRNRWYGVVASKTDALMTLIPRATGVKAVLLATQMRAQRDAGAPQVRVSIDGGES